MEKNNLKNLLASLAHSHRALRAQLASLARISAPRARDLVVVALRAQRCALHSAYHSGVYYIVLAERYQNFYF